MVFFITLLVFIIAYNVNKDKDVSDYEPMTPDELARVQNDNDMLFSSLFDK